MSPKPEIAFIGLGAMGFGMATHLVKQGYPVTGFDVWQPTLDRFTAAGGVSSTTPADCVRGKKYVVCMVATAQQAQAVLFDSSERAAAVPALEQGAALLVCSTVPCAYIQGLERELGAARPDVLLVDAPVSGGAGRAADGTLSIMAGGSGEALGRADFLLRELSDAGKLYVFAGGVGSGSNGKMVHQVLAACQILGASEIMGFAAHLGLDLRRVRERVVAEKGDGGDSSGKEAAWAWMFEHRTPRMLTDGFQPIASALTIILKDTSIITAEAMRYGFPTPMTGAAEQGYFLGLGRGYGADDDSSLIRLYTDGISLSSSEVKLPGAPPRAPPADAADEEAKMSLVFSLCRGIYLASAAETMAFSHTCGLDLEQVLDLCVNAAGGSAVLQRVGPEMIRRLKGGGGQSAASVVLGGSEGLAGVAADLQKAVEEAQRRRMPLWLGAQALSLMRLALKSAGDDEKLPEAALLKVWSI